LKKVPIIGQFGEYFKKYIGSDDYRNASAIMRKIMVNHVNTDLSEDAKHISASTLLIWGESDTFVSLDDAKRLEELIPDSALIVLPGTHYAYLENLEQVTNIIKSLLGGRK
jgi:pimeloyl-ACP methyl ester carboxylesterase